ncbi:PP2C family protein-serine/threonine phosphatase [Amycolatopsis sp. 195334CR]|uniref:PP2C family protein-serine/threonine phosphatase n=1 Tax=Amycolatopsis sp. 195334CR TaxID=2814588 RepID=UPI001A8E10DF|nr:GAF domain-containing SpoIIE family protein phosphatase [Amycolatopsis sp. 195334CR]MBN6033705.1 SpoIIE family protein phosphatase [Amycolatopsis sp. 195334CR]
MSQIPGLDGRLRVLEAITDSALSHLEFDKLLVTLLERVRSVLGVDTATVLRHDSDAGLLTAIASSGIEEEVFQGVRVPVGAGFAGRIAATRSPLVLDDVGPGTVVNPLLWERGLAALLGVPLLAGDDLVGVLHVGSVDRRDFTDTDTELLQLIATRLALAVQLEDAAADRAAATALQRGLLPAHLPAIGDLDFAARYVPGANTGVGGDWYDQFELPGGRLGIVIGDVAGHGLGAAVVMGRLRSALRAYALDYDDPADVIGKLDRKARHFEAGIMSTVGYGVLDPAHERVSISLAGHLPPVLARPTGDATSVPVAPDPPIGLAMPVVERHSTTIDLPPGGLLCWYTDGLVERRGASLDDGVRKLTAAITAGPPEQVCAAIMTELIGREPVPDDIAMLIVRRRASLGGT